MQVLWSSEDEVKRKNDDDDGMEDTQTSYDQRSTESGGLVIFETFRGRRGRSREEDEE